ncbi:MAG: ectoine/hydroxyectoine ABC transporter permease subunit EhuC [Parvibaculaceae bacterium]
MSLEFLPTLLSATLVTLEILAFAAPLSIVTAFTLGLSCLSRLTVLRAAATMIVEFLRGISALILLFWLFFAFPLFGLSLPAKVCAVVALGLSAGSYGAEIVRGAILAVPRVQREAAIALNFSSAQRMFRILIPQALPSMLPPFGNLMIELLKSTSLASMVTVADLTFRAVQLNATYLRTVETFTLVLCIYFVLALAITGLVWLLERQLGRFRTRYQ